MSFGDDTLQPLSADEQELQRFRDVGCKCGHSAPHNIQGEGNITLFFCSVVGCSCLAPPRERRLELDLVWHRNMLAKSETETIRFYKEGGEHGAKEG